MIPAFDPSVSRYWQVSVDVTAYFNADHPTFASIPGPRPIAIRGRSVFSPDERTYICSADPCYFLLHLNYFPVFAPDDAVSDAEREAWDEALNDGAGEDDYHHAWSIVANVRDVATEPPRFRDGIEAVYQGAYTPDREGQEDAREYAAGNHLI